MSSTRNAVRVPLFLAHADRGLSYADTGIDEQVLRRRNEIEDNVADRPSAAHCGRIPRRRTLSLQQPRRGTV